MKRFLSPSATPFIVADKMPTDLVYSDKEEGDAMYNKVQQLQWEDDIVDFAFQGGKVPEQVEITTFSDLKGCR